METGFLLALNPRNKHHRWALRTLEETREKEIILNISPIAPIELSLIMKSREYDNSEILQVLNALDSIIRRYTKPYYPQLELEHIIYATELRIRYPELTFFDSIHTSIAILNNLTYYDLDNVIKTVIDAEIRHKGKK